MFIYFVTFSQKHGTQYATELPALQSATVIVSKYGAQCTEVVYAHEASIFRAIEARVKLPLVPEGFFS